MIFDIAMILVAAVAILIVAIYAHYRYWRSVLLARLNGGSVMIDLARGPVEYARMGEGPVILISHGGGTGWDAIKIYDYLARAGYQLICPSKPGYLRTPIEVATTFEDQADMFAEFLDGLGIKERVVITGASLGGPAALQFALRHQDRVSCIFLQDAVSGEYHANEEAKNSMLGRMFLSKAGRDLVGYLMSMYGKLSPTSLFATYLSVETTYDKGTIKKLSKEAMSDPENAMRLHQLMEVVSPMGARCRGMDMEMELSARLPRYPLENITVPVLVTHSRVDKDVTPSHGEFVAKTVKNAELYSFDGCGHMFWFGGEGRKIEAKVVEFLNRHARG